MWAEVTHEALFEHWTRLQGWLTTGRDDLRFHRRLAEAAEHWDRAGRPEGLLWRPPDLDLLDAFQRRARADMTALEVDFHHTSLARERARRLAKRATVSGLVLLLILMGGLGVLLEHQRRLADEQTHEAETARHRAEEQRGLAEQQRLQADMARQQAEEQRTLATARELAARANLALASFSEWCSVLSTLLSVESVRRQPTFEGQMALMAGLRVLRCPIARLPHDAWVEAVAFSPDGTRLATASKDRTARLYDKFVARLRALLAAQVVIRADRGPVGVRSHGFPSLRSMPPIIRT